MSLNHEELFKELAATPQVKQATRAKAEKLKDYVKTRWVEVNDVSDRDRDFLYREAEDVVLVSEVTEGTNRPVFVVTVRHPGAVAKQAKSSFLTKAVKDVR